MKKLKIVSGGQTGVDRAALDAALECAAEAGGWCPEGRLAEDGVIPARYSLTELARSGYRLRTRRNVTDSDGTAVILLHSTGAMPDRSRRGEFSEPEADAVDCVRFTVSFNKKAGTYTRTGLFFGKRFMKS